MDEAQLQTIWQNRQTRVRTRAVSEPLTRFMKHTLGKRVKQLAEISEAWSELVPSELSVHTALEGLSRSVLTVAVDTSSHRYKLRKSLDAGLMKKIQDRYKGPLNKIRIIPGQFRKVDEAGADRYEFYLPVQD
ncbi:MAG TPA: DUF721 domain-containing protein [Phycisphaerae bacterium]|nr:DUF721 domain-containing protein [Phycisphaerae bacterium]